ncbi:hypothetical protein R1sor_005745 [Riccia sorocarpa]|uniref:Uncharacterized protein n=1 Tax=Riccia sorocarpa TaxID=122646 RepID=A0ABD3HNW0_9MARC
MRLFLQQQQAEEKKESHATKALRAVVGSLNRFEGKNVSRFLNTYNMEMELNGVPEDEMIRSFELAVVPQMKDQVKTLMTNTHDPELQEKLEVRLEDNEAKIGLTRMSMV